MNNVVSKRILSLNGWRIFMIMIIVINHFNLTYLQGFFGEIYSGILRLTKFSLSYFFFLSGFGMMLSDISRHPEPEVAMLNIRKCVDYGVAHVKKIYPTYIGTVFIGVLFAFYTIIFINHTFSLTILLNQIIKIIIHVFLLQSVTGMTIFTHPYNGVTWFLSALFCIYIVSPIFIYYMRKISKSLLTDMMLISGNFVLLIVVALICGRIQSRIPKIDILVYGSPYIRFFYVLIGMNVAMIYTRIKNICFELSCFCFSIFEIGIILIVLGYYTFILGVKGGYQTFNLIISYFFEFVITSLFILVFSFEKGCISKILQKSIFQILGNMSMYIYLIHFILFTLTFNVLSAFNISSNSFTIFALLFALTITFIISFILYKSENKKSIRMNN